MHRRRETTVFVLRFGENAPPKEEGDEQRTTTTKTVVVKSVVTGDFGVVAKKRFRRL